MVITFFNLFCKYMWRCDGFGVEFGEVSRGFLGFL